MERFVRGARCAPAAALLGLVLMIAATPLSPARAEGEGLGSTLSGLLEAGHRLSPQLRVSALETEAAAARADGAGALPDPTFSVGIKRSTGMTEFMLEQTFPLWGKRGLQKTAALDALEATRGRERATRDAFDERMKVEFARYVAVSGEIVLNRAIISLTRQAAGVRRERYGQGNGTASEAILTEAEAIQAETDAVRLEADRRAVRARINALLLRAPEAPLAAPARGRVLPSALPPVPALVARATASNPTLAAAEAEVQGANAQAELARKAWYPDVTLGAGPVQRDSMSPSYDVTVSISIPFQTGPKIAGEREAVANANAARSRVDATRADIGGELGAQVAAYDAARQVADILGRRLIPNYSAAKAADLARYGAGPGAGPGASGGGLDAALLGDRRIRQARLELLKSRMDAEIALAAIERLIGEDL